MKIKNLLFILHFEQNVKILIAFSQECDIRKFHRKLTEYSIRKFSQCNHLVAFIVWVHTDKYILYA